MPKAADPLSLRRRRYFLAALRGVAAIALVIVAVVVAFPDIAALFGGPAAPSSPQDYREAITAMFQGYGTPQGIAPVVRAAGASSMTWCIVAAASIGAGMLVGFAMRSPRSRRTKQLLGLMAAAAQIAVAWSFWEGSYAVVYSATFWGVAGMSVFGVFMTKGERFRTAVLVLLVLAISGGVFLVPETPNVSAPGELWGNLSLVCLALGVATGMATFALHSASYEGVNWRPDRSSFWTWVRRSDRG